MPAKTNNRDLLLEWGNERNDSVTISYYPANMMPPPDEPDAFPVERKAATAMIEFIEDPEEALARRRKGGRPPDHGVPTPARSELAATGPKPNVP